MAVDNYADIFTNTQRKTAPQALMATLEEAKRGKVGKVELEKAASEFESVFLGQMLQAMHPDDGEPNPLFGENEGDEVFKNMMVEEYAKQISKSGSIGIASYIERELLGQQEVSKDVHNRNYKLGRFKPESVEEVSATTTSSQTAPVTTAAKPMSNADQTISDIFQGGLK